MKTLRDLATACFVLALFLVLTGFMRWKRNHEQSQK